MPAASQFNTSHTVMRSPRIHGWPERLPGSIVMRGLMLRGYHWHRRSAHLGPLDYSPEVGLAAVMSPPSRKSSGKLPSAIKSSAGIPEYGLMLMPMTD